jgi:hypothetical protein
MRKLIAALVVLALLVVGADIAGRLIAQQQASQALGSELPTATDPAVHIGGFSFLAQAVTGDYSHLTITADGLALGPVHGASMRADLYDVSFPLSDALSGSLDRLSAARARLNATIPGGALASALDQPGLTMTPGGAGVVRMHTTIAVAGRTFPVTVDVAVSVRDDALHLTAHPVQVAGVSIPDGVAGALQQRLTDTIPLSALPFPLESASVAASDGNLLVDAAATDVPIGHLATSGS